jgi:hypothetical protein
LKDNSPSLSNLRKALEESLLMATAFLPKQAAVIAAETTSPAVATGGSSAVANTGMSARL